MNWQRFWHLISTTRYTRSLEAQIEHLHAEVARLQGDNRELLCAIHPSLRSVRTEAQVVEAKQKRPLKPFNSF